MVQIDACQPPVMLRQRGRALSVQEIGDFVPNPGFRDLNGSQSIRREGQEPIKRFNNEQCDHRVRGATRCKNF